MGRWTLDTSPAYIAFDLMSRVLSPYFLNPMNLNPLRGILTGGPVRVRFCPAPPSAGVVFIRTDLPKPFG